MNNIIFKYKSFYKTSKAPHQFSIPPPNSFETIFFDYLLCNSPYYCSHFPTQKSGLCRKQISQVAIISISKQRAIPFCSTCIYSQIRVHYQFSFQYRFFHIQILLSLFEYTHKHIHWIIPQGNVVDFDP